MLIQLLLPVVSALLFVSALLAASETALFALVRMEHTRGTLSASVTRALDRLMRRPAESLIVVLGLNEAANVCAECLATSLLLLWLLPSGNPVVFPQPFGGAGRSDARIIFSAMESLSSRSYNIRQLVGIGLASLVRETVLNVAPVGMQIDLHKFSPTCIAYRERKRVPLR